MPASSTPGPRPRPRVSLTHSQMLDQLGIEPRTTSAEHLRRLYERQTIQWSAVSDAFYIGDGPSPKAKTPKQLNDEKKNRVKDEAARLQAIDKFAKNLPALPDTQLITAGIELTVMAMRENLMTYFKGDCVQNLVHQLVGDVSVSSRLTSGGSHYYERRENQNQDARYLKWKGVKVAKLSREPDTIEFYPGLFNRSPENQLVYDQVKLFLSEYLMGVQSKEDKKSSSNSSFDSSSALDDRKYMIAIARDAPKRSRGTSSYDQEYYDMDDSYDSEEDDD